MADNSNQNTVEAYKSIIDFNKTIITISSSVLTALIAYIVYQNIELNFFNYLSIFSLIGAILLSLYGFGNAIHTVKKGDSRKGTILMTNIGGFLLMVGIVLLLTFNAKKQKSVDQVLKRIEQATSSLNNKLIPPNFKSIELIDNNYLVKYSMDSTYIQVIYSMTDNKIISIK